MGMLGMSLNAIQQTDKDVYLLPRERKSRGEQS